MVRPVRGTPSEDGQTNIHHDLRKKFLLIIYSIICLRAQPPAVTAYLHQYKVHLTVARERKSILGDYRHRTHYQNHRISVNGNLNKFSFLITLLHELAHLLTFEQHGNSVAGAWAGMENDLWTIAATIFRTQNISG